MTEPAVASSDATNIETRIERDGDEYVINGRKWWTSGAADPRCKVLIVMGKTDPEAATHRQQSMVVVPADTPGVDILRSLPGLRSPGPARPLRGRAQRRPRAGHQRDRRGGRRLRGRPGAARPGPDPPRDARAGRGGAGAGPDGDARPGAGRLRPAAGRERRRTRADRRVPRRARPGPGAVPPGGVRRSTARATRLPGT